MTANESETIAAAAPAAEEMSLEEAFARLDELAARLEDRDIPLEEAFGLYRQGMALLKSCNDKIDKVEKKMLEITEDGEILEFPE